MRAVAGERWIFGYGSLVWRPAFDHLERAPGYIRNFARRFWQGSPDHRGVPHAPGRVVTLAPEPGAICWGMGYRIAPQDWEDVLRVLDDRESGGFERIPMDLCFSDTSRPAAPALAYVARSGNPNFLGPAPLGEMVAQIRRARGKSGTNVDYVLRLASALRELEMEDEHVFALAEQVGAD